MQRRRFDKSQSLSDQPSNNEEGAKHDLAEAKQEDADARAMKWAMSPGLQPPK